MITRTSKLGSEALATAFMLGLMRDGFTVLSVIQSTFSKTPEYDVMWIDHRVPDKDVHSLMKS